MSSITRERLQSVIARVLGVHLTSEEMAHTAHLDEVVPLDSVALLELAVGVEKEFGIRFEKDCFKREFLNDLPGLLGYLDQRGSGVAR